MSDHPLSQAEPSLNEVLLSKTSVVRPPSPVAPNQAPNGSSLPRGSGTPMPASPSVSAALYRQSSISLLPVGSMVEITGWHIADEGAYTGATGTIKR